MKAGLGRLCQEQMASSMAQSGAVRQLPPWWTTDQWLRRFVCGRYVTRNCMTHDRTISAPTEMGAVLFILVPLRSRVSIRIVRQHFKLFFVSTMDDRNAFLIVIGLVLAVMMMVFVGLLLLMRHGHRQDSSAGYTTLRPMEGEAKAQNIIECR
jgi:hypothetical protein